MVVLAIISGIYSYLILSLGLLGWLYRLPVFIVSIPFLIFGAAWIKKDWHFNYLKWITEIRKDKFLLILLGILIIQVIINFLGAISPELSFDALWYHLTPPKLYVQNHQIFHIPGWLLSVSTLPRLTEMFYTVALLFSNEILAKIIHFAFGIFVAIALFNLLKRYLPLRTSLLGVVTFYTMLIIGWQSTTAYVDLTRTFFEILALDLFLKWIETEKEIFLWEAGILTGLAISTKILAFGTLFAFLFLILILRGKKSFWQISKFIFLAVLVASPWFTLSFINTGNPLFPLFGSFREPSISIEGPSFSWISKNIGKLPLLLWNATIHPDDIISPVFLIFLPLVLVFLWKQKLSIKISGLYFLLGVFFAPTTSNRYLLPYLPALILLIFVVLEGFFRGNKNLEKIFLGIIIFSAILNTGSRGLATRKFLPYLLGKETKKEFLTKNLNFSFGDFYDVDGFFAENIKDGDLVLIYNIHNLYYVDFPFVHESWAKPGTYFTHILVGEGRDLPEKFGEKLLLYQNSKTKVKLYLFADKYK